MSHDDRPDVIATFRFTARQWEKLQALAETRRKTSEDCLRDFADSCQPGGTGWKHPSDGKKPEVTGG